MRISATKAVIILLVAAILVTGAVYLYVRTQQSSIALEQNVEVLGVEVNKRTAELVSVTLRNNGPTLILEGASLYKIQSGITLVSSKFSPPIILYTGNVTVPMTANPSASVTSLRIASIPTPPISGTLLIKCLITNDQTTKDIASP